LPVSSKNAALKYEGFCPRPLKIVYDNYNFFVIGYSATERPSDCIVSRAAAANGVGLFRRFVNVSLHRTLSGFSLGS
jgi:hypothetical protein